MAELTIESLDQEGRGIAHGDGKVIFVEGALPGERVTAEHVRRKPSYDVARTIAVHRANAARVAPRCPHFGVCGGCTLQHADEALQVAASRASVACVSTGCCRRSPVPRGVIAIAHACRCATCRRRAAS
jgi:23S rRNA (uracil1939-C5)-methyltransferase